MPKTKVLFCAESLDMNGAMTSLLSLLEALPRDLYDISLFLCSHDGILQSKIPKGITLLPEVEAYAAFRLSFKRGIVHALHHCHPLIALARFFVPILRILHLPGRHFWWLRPIITSNEYPFVFAYADGLIAQVVERRVLGGKKYLWIHTDYRVCPESSETAKAFQSATGAVAVSNDAGAAFQEWFRKTTGKMYAKPVYTLYNIIDEVAIYQRSLVQGIAPIKRNGYVRLLTVGRISLQKNPYAILRIARILKSRGLHFEWYFVGPGERAPYQKVARELAVDDCVFYVGEYINPMPWMASADIVIQPSRWEGWGITVSEALVLHRPVVVSDLAVFREQVIPGVNGFLCALDDDEAFADKIEQIAKSPDLYKQLSTFHGHYPFTAEAVCKSFSRLVAAGNNLAH